MNKLNINSIIKFFSILLCFLCVNINLYAEENDFNIELLNNIEKYLNNINSIESRFVQLNPDASLSEGVFYLQKPGKFRWEYKDQPIIIIANGNSLIYKDTELEQVNYIPMEKSIAALLVRKKLSFLDDDLEILDLTTNEYATKLSFVKKGQNDIKEFTFIFQNEPFKLGKISLINNNDDNITISFFDMKINQEKLPEQLFKIKDPRLF